MSSNLLGIDPGFANIGLAVVKASTDKLEPLTLRVFTTEKAAKKANTFASDDNVKRTQEIVRTLTNLIKEYDIKAICAESMSFPRNSSAAAKMSLCWGALAAIGEQFGIPIVQSSPQQVKIAVTGSKAASKDEVQEKLKSRFEGVVDLTTISVKLTKSNREHPYDALAAVVACADSQLIKMLRNT